MESRSFEGRSFAIIINPSAGNFLGKKDWPKIKSILHRYNVHYTHAFTKRKGHAIQLVIEFIKLGYRNFIAVGGDGTMNEVVNGMCSQDFVPLSSISVGLIPVGSGNDWLKTYEIPNDYEAAIKVLEAGKIFQQDIGLIQSHDDKNSMRYFLNIAGGGFDGFVAKRVNEVKENKKSNPLIYLYILLSSLFRYKTNVIKFHVDGKIVEEDVLSFSIGIGKYNGGGMMQLPNAIPNDGLFDITIIKRMSKLDVIKSIRLLYDGNIIFHPKVSTFVGHSIQVLSETMVDLEADGENAGFLPVDISIITQKLNVFV